MSGVTLSRRPCSSSLNSTLTSMRRRPNAFALRPDRAAQGVERVTAEDDVGEHRSAVEGMEVFGPQPLGIDEIAPQQIEGDA